MALLSKKTKDTKKKDATSTAVKLEEGVSYGWVLKKPLISEKAALAADNVVYTFVIDMRANKHQVAQAIQERFGSTPVKVNVAITKPQKVRRRTGLGKTNTVKKAIVTMPAGTTLELF